MSDNERRSRRRFLRLTGASAAVGLAGCGGGDGGGDGDGSGGNGDGDSNGGDDSGDGADLGPVPSAYETATSLDGTERNPDALATKSGVEYQSSPRNGQRCSGCRYYVPDQNGDGLGACAIVEGKIEPDGYCVSYAAYDG
ncbi:high-potential iron-sulfur protein [Haloplanus sp. GCM10025708]|uniref:high-potential iron-sulfur protein n=1 Tax=Haloferacaceae TaxID=1644056 RepID=UPI00361F3D1B